MGFIQKNKIISLIVLAVLVLGIGWVVFPQKDKVIFQASIASTINADKQTSLAPIKRARLNIDDGDVSQDFEFSLKTATTSVFDLLKRAEKEYGLEIETIDYGDMGLLIEAIAGKRNGEGNKNWIYYINNELAKMAVNKQIIKPGDKVEFKFELSPF